MEWKSLRKHIGNGLLPQKPLIVEGDNFLNLDIQCPLKSIFSWKKHHIGSKEFCRQKCHLSLVKKRRLRQNFSWKCWILPFSPTNYKDFYCNFSPNFFVIGL